MKLSIIRSKMDKRSIELPLTEAHIRALMSLFAEGEHSISRVGLDFIGFTILFRPEELRSFSMERILRAGFRGRLLLELKTSSESHQGLLEVIQMEVIRQNKHLIGDILDLSNPHGMSISEVERAERSTKLSSLLKAFYGHQCMMCYLFILTDGVPYTEAHHVIPLSEGGPNSPENIAVVCPNCHARFHHGARVCKERLKKIFMERNPFIDSAKDKSLIETLLSPR